MSKKILIIDDEEEIRWVVKTLGQMNNWTVIEAEHGQAGIDILSKEQDFSVIVSDNRMPHKTGIEVLRWTRGQNINIPFIIQSGFSKAEYEKEAEELKLFAYVEKPWQSADLVQIIKSALGENE